jgi:hypothetical protein
MDRATAIRRSLTAFVCGLIGLVPILGFFLSLYSLGCWVSVNRRYKEVWNPAATYLTWGLLLALVGLVVTTGAVFAIAMAIVAKLADGG